MRTVKLVAFAAVLSLTTVLPHAVTAQQQKSEVTVGPKSIGGVVSSPKGREAGVWVIAETTELPTRFARIVVTDDQGRYLVPDLPRADYSIWVRGYGLVDSPKMRAKPGQRLDLEAAAAPNDADAAHYYPAIYWYSLLPIPDAKEFGGKSDIPAGISQQDWLVTIKNRACVGCHQLGQEATRTIPAAFADEHTGADAWMRRVQSGQAAPFMVNPLAGQLGGAPFQYFGKWTDGIAAGQLPREKPARPQGAERNLVVTEWDWGAADKYLHDLVSTDKRNPTVNANGKLWASPEYATDELPVLDPVSNTVTTYRAPVRDPDMPLSLGEGHAATVKPMLPSVYWGDKAIWDTRANNHNDMIDSQGRVWLSATVRARPNPAFCKEGSQHPSAKAFPLKESSRQLAMLDPKTMKYTFIDTCFQTHHLQFGFDKDETLWTSGGGPVVGWFNTKVFDETGDAEKAQGWTALVLDTNGNGKRDAAVEPKDPVDPQKDKRIDGGFYAIMPSPVDHSVWGTVGVFGGKGAIVRLDPGSDPPATALAEIYNVPAPYFGPRGADIDSKGVVWVSLGSGHLGSFDRKKCKAPANGPNATGDQCPEGWSFYQYPGPGVAGIGNNSAEASYYTWVDQHNTLGLGNDVPISTGNENDALLALVNGKWVIIRVPYPLSFYAKGLDGRIDDPNGGWKGRGLWTTSGDRAPWLKEGGKGTLPIAFHFQLRPNPLTE